MRRRFAGIRRLAGLLLFCAVAACPALAQQEEPKLNPIKWSLKAQLPAASLKVGEKFTVALTAEIERGWHLYSTTPIEGGPRPTRITLVAGQGFESAGKVEMPDPLVEKDPNFGVEVEFYEGQVTFTLPVRVAANSAAGQRSVAVQVRYQTCNDKLCLPPNLLKLETPVAIAASATSASANTVTAQAAQGGQPSTPQSQTAPVEFVFTDLNGKARKLSEFRGKIVLLDFWATWCKPCLADFPHLKELYTKYQASGFEIIGLDCETLGDDTADAETIQAGTKQARAVVQRFGATWTMAETKSAVPIAEKRYQVKTLPTKVLLDREGNVLQKIKDGQALEQVLNQLLAR